ncbi:hypothetical protein ACRAWC_12120 [Leifsonia sp. L25]|uniref:hypothetical protein n=1 Tax=Actinomycetes TaxID=1760 RepID=UPI003D68FBC3
MITRITRGRARSALAVLLAVGALVAASGAPAQAAPDDGTSSVRDFLAQYGADEATQDRLLAEYGWRFPIPGHRTARGGSVVAA